MAKIVECLKNLGYEKLTDLQRRVFKIITTGEQSIVIVAPTGSGKTEAALFPLMYLIKRRGLKPISVIYVSPLRALNRDLEERIKRIAECFEVTVALRHGDTPYSIRKHIEEKPPHILITTPETLNYILVNEKLRRFLTNLEFIVIDEYRELVESKRGYLLFTIMYLMEKYLLKSQK